MMENNDMLEELFKNEFLKENPNNIKVFFKYLTARIDIKNFGNSDNDLVILKNSDENSKVSSPEWFKDSEGVGWIIQSRKGSMDLKIKIVNDGKLRISLRGMDFRDSRKNRMPIYIDYTRFSVDGRDILDSRVTVWHDDPTYQYIKEGVKDGDILNLHFEWEPADVFSVYVK